jgi:hypothetical protein
MQRGRHHHPNTLDTAMRPSAKSLKEKNLESVARGKQAGMRADFLWHQNDVGSD